ncbi:MAG: DUF2336 domain-containing protein, partial [Proteobacteria bacterium]|nr:DUF2336 domain-containing protein [Pseudomonadota bacterium]
MKGFLKGLLKGGGKDKPLSYEEAREMARHANMEIRMELASRSDVKPEILYFLSEDPAAEVRRLIASNEVTPAQADLLLAKDTDQDVRGELAGKIAKLAPGLSADEQDQVRRMTYEALEILARDQVTRVRQILSEALKDVANAPPEVIRRLARDAELVVAGPVLQFSPVLTDEDLLEIIESHPATGCLSAISRRDGVAGPVVDAIVATDDEEAMVFLLANESAQIRENTLDDIIERALDFEPWHAPLVSRPQLSSKAAVRLARFVAHNLLSRLSERQDLAPDALEEVRQVVERRLEEEPPEGEEAELSTAEEALAKAKELMEAGTLDEDSVTETIRKGNRELTMASLSLLSGLKIEVVRSVVSNRSAKGMLAVAWKAGLSAKLAETLQKRLALVSLKDLLRAQGPDYPLDDADLDWQLD